jgi:hypothetical protein
MRAGHKAAPTEKWQYDLFDQYQAGMTPIIELKFRNSWSANPAGVLSW